MKTFKSLIEIELGGSFKSVIQNLSGLQRIFLRGGKRLIIRKQAVNKIFFDED